MGRTRRVSILIAIFCLIIAVMLFIIAARQRKQAGIPAGRIIYTDTSRWGKVEKPLYSQSLRLTGKPDYLVDQGQQVIPVEVKSGKAPPTPRDSHIYQLAAYCLLAWQEYGVRPNFGIIHYPNRTYAVDFTATLEESVKAIIQEMRSKSTRSQVNRSHDEPQRCIHCGYRSRCDQSLRI